MQTILGQFLAWWRKHRPATHHSMARVYLDYAAATPVQPLVAAAMEPYWSEQFGNPGALHQEGRSARQVVDQARQTVATTTGVKPEHVVFTASGTESNNLAIRGYITSLAAAGRPMTDMEIVTTRLEHPATQETVQALEQSGVTVTYVPVTEVGLVTPTALREVLTTRTVLVSIAHVNSEVGVVQPTQALARTLRAYAKEQSLSERPLFHIDAAQSPWWHKCQLDRLGADMLSLDGGKCGGPKGGGILLFAGRRHVTRSVMYGGGQEFGLRPGTEPVPIIVGTAVALQIAQAEVEERVERIQKVRDDLWETLQSVVPDAVWNGPVGAERVANNLHFSLPGLDTEYVAVVLDTHGYAVSTKSACSSADSSASAVIMSMTGDLKRAQSTLRVTLGPDTTSAEVAGLPAVIASVVATMSPYTQKVTK